MIKRKELHPKIKNYLVIRKSIEKLRAELKELIVVKEGFESEILESFNQENINSRVFYGKKFSVIKKEDVKVYDEQALLREFRNKAKEMDYLGEFTNQKVNTIKFKKFAKKLFKDKNQLLAGTEYQESESLRVVDIIGDIINLEK